MAKKGSCSKKGSPPINREMGSVNARALVLFGLKLSASVVLGDPLLNNRAIPKMHASISARISQLEPKGHQRLR